MKYLQHALKCWLELNNELEEADELNCCLFPFFILVLKYK